MRAHVEKPHLAFVVGARPNFMKASPVLSALGDKAKATLIHTGQHYDDAMSSAFFRDLKLPPPDVHLGVGSGSHAMQTARVMMALEKHLDADPPDVVVVVGDVNSTLAAGLVAAKLSIPVAHIEAGLRSFDWRMPEEINRVLTDRLSRWLFTPSADGNRNLESEGVPTDRIFLVGNVMIDALLQILPAARKQHSALRDKMDLPDEYAVLTLHRPSNVDSSATLSSILEAVGELSRQIPVIFPMHPRTGRALGHAGEALGGDIRSYPPMGYLEFISLLDGSRLVLTDSGGVQEETSVLGVQCLTLRENTERPITCELGTNNVVGTSPARIVDAGRRAMSTGKRPAQIPLWDGSAGSRVAETLLRELAER